jgi:hypothetical protein
MLYYFPPFQTFFHAFSKKERTFIVNIICLEIVGYTTMLKEKKAHSCPFFSSRAAS